MSPSYRYQVDIRHDGLKKFRRISGADRYVVEERARHQVALWNQQWARVSARANSTKITQLKQRDAAQRNQEAQNVLLTLENILAQTLSVDDKVNWQSLKVSTAFEKRAPVAPPPILRRPEPRPDDPAYHPTLTWFDRIIPGRRRAKLDAGRWGFEKDHEAWKVHVRECEQREHEAKAAFTLSMLEWTRERASFVEAQNARNAAIDHQQSEYEAKNPEAIVEYCDLVLSASSYPDWISRDWELDYVPATRTLIAEYQLPPPMELPRIKEVKYVKSRDEVQEIEFPEPALRRMYDHLLYQISLRVVHELFEADSVDALGAIAFNGWVRSLDQGTGKEVTTCVLSLYTPKPEFLEVNLARVDPKACFKRLKGVGSSSLHGLTAVAPILQIDRTDRRFVPGQAVIEALEGGTNLAAMDWADFEHLIREVFEKEFAGAGGEVKVTRASRDGGVDAVAFDPDPIRGGKIVIQAKRYTNTVGVSAVRDLYGTLLNEGATKGVLVTTSDYGPDAYEFAKGKPITLLNGSNLLHLLNKHGHRARIDLKEAKQQIVHE